jgi:eukaryotic-like serine/threonine-protein kinase
MQREAGLPTTWPRGHRLSQYSIVDVIGEGGMGVVYLADDLTAGRQVALKVLHSDIASNPTKRRRFVREGKFLNALTHPGIATVYEVGEADDRVFIAMEYVQGTTLKEVIARTGRLGVERTMTIITEIGSALAQAHAAGIIHRDFKPDNIIIGADQQAKLLDFGIAKVADTAPVIGDGTTTELTTKGQILGTPAYMSPEQAKGLEVDQRSDVFSLGIVLYEMIAGRRPFQGETWQELIIAVNRDTPEPVKRFDAQVPPELERILSRCLEKDPDKRYKSSVELAADLDAIHASFKRQAMAAAQGSALAAPPAPLDPSSGVDRLPALPAVVGPATVRRPTRTFLSRYPWAVAAIVVVLLAAMTVVGMIAVLQSGH